MSTGVHTEESNVHTCKFELKHLNVTNYPSINYFSTSYISQAYLCLTSFSDLTTCTLLNMTGTGQWWNSLGWIFFSEKEADRCISVPQCGNRKPHTTAN